MSSFLPRHEGGPKPAATFTKANSNGARSITARSRSSLGSELAGGMGVGTSPVEPGSSLKDGYAQSLNRKLREDRSSREIL